MREATGNALLTMMITAIITIIMMFFVGSLSYSKAFRIKNYIVNQIEENRGWDSKTLIPVIDSYLKKAGYYVKGNFNCDSKFSSAGTDCEIQNLDSQYQYCVYKCGKNNSTKNVYYKVVTYSKFEFPVIRNIVTFTVKGETITFNDFN